SVLVARNDTLTARADADVRITGPFAAATVSGNVALTNTRFLKNIDLLPIGLPGRPAPQAPTERPEFFSLPSPPFRDWKFDVTITGPFAAGTVRGNVSLTNPRFLKNIHLLPLGLPGRPPPRPPPERPEFFSLPSPPFRDWKFDVTIKTKDPVLIRGNLATGEATTDLKLIGTGLQPGLQGVVQMQNVEATLPFSRLNVSRGSLNFNPNDSTNPTIDLQ